MLAETSLTAITTWVFLGMTLQALHNRIWGFSAMLLCRSSSSVRLDGDCRWTAIVRSRQRFLIGFKSGLWLGHSSTFKPLLTCIYLSCFCLFLYLHYFSLSASLVVYCYYFSFPDSVSHYALVFPSHVSVFLCYLNPSTPESVSSHSLVISGFLAFSEFFLRSSFSWFPALLLIYIVINSPVLCSS